MSAHFPDVETIRSALMLAVRAPSVHNSQPWLWRVATTVFISMPTEIYTCPGPTRTPAT